MEAEGKGIRQHGTQQLADTPRLGPSATHWPLSSHLPPFPVQSPYQAKPDLLKCNDPLLHEDCEWHDWIREKEIQDRQGNLLHIDTRLPEHRLAELTQAIVSFFKSHCAHGPIDAQGGFAWLGGLKPQDPETMLRALALSLQEDFVLMTELDPKEKVGASMHTLHEPVADNEKLQAAMPALSHAICTKGPFVRHVWTLTGDGARARQPGWDSTVNLTHADQLWFRCERQVTIPLAKGSLFLIRVLTAPFRQVVNGEERLTQLMDALDSMSPEMLSYKHLHHARRLVLADRGSTARVT